MLRCLSKKSGMNFRSKSFVVVVVAAGVSVNVAILDLVLDCVNAIFTAIEKRPADQPIGIDDLDGRATARGIRRLRCVARGLLLLRIELVERNERSLVDGLGVLELADLAFALRE